MGRGNQTKGRSRQDNNPSRQEAASVILENPTYLEKLGERIEGHVKVDEHPTIKHEKVINTALTKMWQVGRINRRGTCTKL